MTDLQQQLRTLNVLGIPYSVIAQRDHLDRSTVSKFANDRAPISILVESKIRNAIEKFKEEISRV